MVLPMKMILPISCVALAVALLVACSATNAFSPVTKKSHVTITNATVADNAGLRADYKGS